MKLRVLLPALLVCLVCSTSGQGSDFDPSGIWEGPCKSARPEEQKYNSTLHVEFRREGKVWRAKGGLRSPGRPSGDSEFEEVKVAGQNVSFLGLWGPTIAEFTGTHEQGTIKGKLEGKNDGRLVFSCAWSVTRVKN
jgi:hypothetical protein